MNKINPYMIFMLRLLLGSIFIYASLDKIVDPGKFARDISNYHMLPYGLENTVAIVLPWLELFIGIGIVIGVLVNANVLIAGSLLILFILMVSQAILRGFNIDCGCGFKDNEVVGWSKIIENLLFLGASYVIYWTKFRIMEIYPKSSL